MMSTLSLAVPTYPQVVLETSWRRRRIRAFARCTLPSKASPRLGGKFFPWSANSPTSAMTILARDGSPIRARSKSDCQSVKFFAFDFKGNLGDSFFLFQPLSLFPVTLSTSFMKRLRREPPSEISPLPPSRIPADKERLNASTASMPSSMVPFATKLITRTGRI